MKRELDLGKKKEI